MSDRAVQSLSDTNGRNGQTMQAYQSVWMAHWTRTSFHAAGETSQSMPNAKMRMLDHEQCDHEQHNQSADLICERKMCHSQLGDSIDACFRESIRHDRYLSTFSQGWFSKTHECSGIRMLPSQWITSEETESTKSHNDYYSVLKLQNCDHVETKRICITEKIDVNLSKENDIFTSTRVISKINGDIHGQGKQRMELQPLSSSIDSEMKENIGNDMEMNSFREKYLHSGSYSTASTKVFNMKSNLPPWITLASSQKVGYQQPKIELPDMNFPALPGAASSSENTSPISSNIQTLEMANVDQPKRKSNFSLDGYPNEDPWVKRLKLTSSNSSAQCTKTSNSAENSSHEKVGNFSKQIIEYKDKELIEEPNKKANSLLLSHAWIQRWLGNGSRIAEKKAESVVVYEPQSSKLALENLQKEQFCPSIAAMALMGKALACFQPCELQKRGSFTVWNTKAF